MDFEEWAAKPMIRDYGIEIPQHQLIETAEEAKNIANELGSVVIKAQVPTGKRGKAGGIQIAQNPLQAQEMAEKILDMTIYGHKVQKVLVEQKVDIEREFYASVLNDPVSKGPVVMFSTEGGMEIEELASEKPELLGKFLVNIREGFSKTNALEVLSGLHIEPHSDALADILVKLYTAYSQNDAELLEINPLALTRSGSIVAVDCKFVMDDSSIKRQNNLEKMGTKEKLSKLEELGEANSVKYIELDGNVGVLANGAGLTMTTMDVIRYHGGEPANFCEIGGEAYTKAKFALKLVLEKPGIKSLVVNFCGAFARCDVMMEGFLSAWEDIKPEIPVFFSIAGTGDVEAISMLKGKLGLSPYEDMDAASKAAVEAAQFMRD